jgi:hypothetical protein
MMGAKANRIGVWMGALTLAACARAVSRPAADAPDAGSLQRNEAPSGESAGTKAPQAAMPDASAPNASSLSNAAIPDAGRSDAGAQNASRAGATAADVRDASLPRDTDAGVLIDASVPSGGVVTVRYTTVLLGGKYSPRNVGAAWVEDASGKFVKTLNRWATHEAFDLVTWRTASNDNMVDAITSATAANFGMRESVWNLTDVDRQVVPDGDYTLKIEVTDSHTAGTVFSIALHKGPTAVDSTAPDQRYLVNIAIDYP